MPEVATRFNCPSWMNKYARILFHELQGHLRALGLLTELDRSAFLMLCQSYGRMREAQETIEREGFSVKGSRGERKHPALTVLHQAETFFLKMAGEFGMTPSSRSRISISPPPPRDDDPFGLLTQP
jgi:P27 family predicted phage terminase small subunit